MTAAEHVARAAELTSQAVHELEDAESQVPPFAKDAFRLLRAEIRVSIRRMENFGRVIGSGRTEAPRP